MVDVIVLFGVIFLSCQVICSTVSLAKYLLVILVNDRSMNDNGWLGPLENRA